MDLDREIRELRSRRPVDGFLARILVQAGLHRPDAPGSIAEGAGATSARMEREDWSRSTASNERMVRGLSGGDWEEVSEALAEGADPNFRAGAGNEPALILAVRWCGRTGDERGVELLLQQGADPNITGRTGENALHEVVASGGSQAVPVLFAYGVDPEKQDYCGRTPLELREVMASSLTIARGLDPAVRAIETEMERRGLGGRGASVRSPVSEREGRGAFFG